MRNLVNSCGGLLKERSVSDFVKGVDKSKFSLLKLYDLQSRGGKLQKKKNIFIVAGEHARELISVEMLIHFVTDLCKNREGSAK